MKKLKVTLLDDYDDLNSIVDMWIIDVQQWCATDIVINVNPARTPDEAKIFTGKGGVQVQILESWNQQDYGAETLPATGNLEDALGGIAEVYLYGRDASNGYDPISTEVASQTLLEESYRLEDSELPGVFDGGEYWVDDDTENGSYRRSMNQGMYQINRSMDNDNTNSVGSMRYSCSETIPIRSTSTDFSSSFIAEYNAEMDRIKQLNADTQFWGMIRIALQIICTAILAALTFSGVGTPAAAFFGALMFGVGIFTAVQVITMVISTINPQFADFLSRLVFDTIDMTIGSVFSWACQTADDVTGWGGFKEIFQPVLYGAYILVSDPGGTVARGLVATGAHLTGMDFTDEVVNIIADDFERDIMAGKAFNMEDYYEWPW